MKFPSRRFRAHAAAAAFTAILSVGFIPHPASAALRTATWTGAAGNNSYSDPGNWDLGGGEIPINNGVDTFTVVIPSGQNIDFDVMGTGHQVVQLSVASGSTLNINPGRDLQVLDAASVSGIVTTNNGTFDASHPASTFGGNATQIEVTGGGSFTHAGTSLDVRGVKEGAVLSASGAGSQLIVSDIQELNGYANFDFGSVRVRSIEATAGGHIDLSGLQTVHGGADTDRVDFIMNTGGTIDLSGLQEIVEGNVQFTTDSTSFELPALTTATGMTFSLPTAGTLSLPVLVSQNGGGYDVPVNGSVSAPSLTTLENASVTIGSGGSFTANNLTDFSGSSLTLGVGQTFTSGTLTDVDNAEFHLTGGATFSAVSDSVYVGHNYDIRDSAIFSADGAGTTLTLTSITEIDVLANHDFGTDRVRKITATNGGVVDLSGLTTIKGGLGGDMLEFRSQAGGTIDLSNVTYVTDGGVRFVSDAAVYTLPSLISATGTSFDMAAGSTLQLDSLTTLTDSTISVAANGTFNASLLSDVSGSDITLGAGQTLNTASLSSIDNATFTVTGGADIASVSDGVYVGHNYDIRDSAIFSADGAGSTLTLTSITEIDVAANHDFGTDRARRIAATNGGVIDLSNLTTIRGGLSGDRLDIIATNGGTVHLDSLTQIVEGNVKVVTDQASYQLANLTNATGLTFEMNDGSTLELPSLTSWTNAAISVPDGGTINATALSTFTGSTLTLAGGQQFNSAALTEITNARFLLSDAATFSDIGATAYNTRGIASGTILSATGSGTVLDASSIEELDSFSNHNFGNVSVRTVEAANGGVIDLSGVERIRGGAVNDRVDFVAQTGGTIDLSNFQTVLEGNTRFAVTGGGRMTFGDLTTNSNMALEVDGTTSELEVGGNFVLGTDSTLAVTNAGKIQVAGDFSHVLTDEADFDADTGIVQMLGSGEQLFEVAGQDLGITRAGNNFGLAQLIVGSESSVTNLVLVDLIDNGNRASPEALYLLGSGGLDGLVLHNGSTLTIGDIPVYAQLDGELIELHSLFGENETVVPFTYSGTDTFIALGPTTIPEPASVMLLTTGLACLRRRR